MLLKIDDFLGQPRNSYIYKVILLCGYFTHALETTH